MTQQRNIEIRKAAKDAGVRFWQIAEILGEAESTLSRRMRHEMPEKEKSIILNAIQKVREVSG